MDDDFNGCNYSDYGGAADLDFSFTSSAGTATTFASSARTSRSSAASLALSFHDAPDAGHPAGAGAGERQYPDRPHRRNDPQWTAVRAAEKLSGDGRLHLRHLKLVRRLGAGDVGRVFLCRLRDFPGDEFALKVVDRSSLPAKKLRHVDTEARILAELDHPFLPTLYAHIAASHYTCLLIDFCPGGDLNRLLRRQPLHRLPLHAARFYAAEVLVALEYLHSKGIVYRDLKPENILLRHDGHIMLSDFDLCFSSEITPKIEITRTFLGNRKEKSGPTFIAEPTAAFSRSCVGTHEYLAPELLTGDGYGSGVDWWAFGVLIYELMYGTTPFKGGTKEATLRNIASPATAARFPADVEPEVRDLIEGLLVKDPRGRLGAVRGAADLKRHPFFDGVKWPLIRGYRPPEIVKGVVAPRRRGRSHVMGHVSRRRSLWRRISYLLKRRGCLSK